MLKKTLNILKNYKKDKEDYNFNDILELFNVTKYLEEELTECCLMPEEKVYFNQEIKRDIWKSIGFFCSRLNESKLIELTHDIYPEYLEDYWTIFEKYTLCRYGFINHDLIEIASTPIIIKDVKSVIKNKYIYPNYKEGKESCFLLFSDQSMLTYLSQRPLKNEYPCLFYLILNGKVNMSEYQEYQKALINRLIEEEVIFLDENGFLQFTNLFDILIMKDLYENEFAVRAFYCNKKVVNIFSESLERLRKKNWIYFGEGLFSTQESEYFNYYLNKKEYFNGLDLRNKYLHGTQRKKGDDEKLHTDNYYTLLMLFIILTIKIRDDLCQKDIVKEEKETNV